MFFIGHILKYMKRFRKVYLEISNVCNLNCSFCPGTKRRAHFMSVEEFDALTGKIREYTDYLYFHLMGEPLLHPELESFLEIAGRKEYKVIITTNGTLLKEKGGLLLNSSAVHKVNISLQSFEANKVNRLENYIGHCAEFAAKAGEKGKICVLRLWNKNGLDSLNPEIESILKTYFPENWTVSRQSLRIGEKVWLEPGEKFDWPDIEETGVNDRLFCYALRDQIGVLCDGTVVPCCLDHEGDIALGNLFENDLDEILNSERALAIFNGFSERRTVEKLCKTCGYATRFSGKNTVFFA